MLIIVANLMVGSHFFREKRSDYRLLVQSVAELRAHQVADWFDDHLRSAALHATSFPQAEYFVRWRTEGDTVARYRLLLRLQQFAESGRFQSVALIAADGTVLSDPARVMDNLPVELLYEALGSASESGAGFVGPYPRPDGRAQLDFFATLPVDHALGRPVVVLHTAAEEFFPEPWREFPVPTQSGEIAVARIEAGETIALTGLRHAGGTIFMPIAHDATGRVLAAQLDSASDGQAASIDIHDYRGVAVFGSGYTIPGTDWYVLAKMDVQEVSQAALRGLLPILIMSVLFFFTVAAGLANLRQRRRLLAARAMQHDLSERLRAMQLLKAIADSADDAIFVKDLEGRYMLFNRAACELTGKSEDEVLGHGDDTLFPPGPAAMLGRVCQQAVAENRIIMTREAFPTASGRVVLLARIGPLHDETGRLIGVYGISRDVTELERAAELLEQHGRRLEERNRELERFNEAMVGRELDMLALKKQVNELCAQLGMNPPFDPALHEPRADG